MTFYPEKSFSDANDEYAKTFTEVEAALEIFPRKRYAIVTCMDARIDTSKAFGVDMGDAHVIRSAGASAQDAIRSLVISQQLLGTNAIFLVKHTDCGMVRFTNEELHATIEANLGVDTSHIDFQPFTDLEQAVQHDIAFLKCHELIPEDVKEHISGWIYHVKTGKLERVAEDDSRIARHPLAASAVLRFAI